MRPPTLLASVVVVVLLAANAAASSPPMVPASLPSETVRLPNGLRVLLAPDPNARLVSVLVSYAAGAGDDPEGLRGLAHMVEHLMFSQSRNAPSVMRVLESAGACQFNATTKLDETTYFESVAPERLETVLWLESDRMCYEGETVTGETLDEERDILRNEDRDRHVDGTLGAVGSFALHELFPAWHPYSSASEAPDGIGRITVDDARAFLRTWYTPSNATLTIAGRFDRDATVATVTRYFGSLRATPAPARPPLPAWPEEDVELTVAANVTSERVRFFWRTPAYGQREDAALDVAATTLAGQGNERLSRALLATHLATRVSAREQSEREGSVFWIDAEVAPGVSTDKVADAIAETVASFANTAGAAEVERAREVLQNAQVSRLETTWGRTSQLAAMSKIGDLPGPSFDWGVRRYDSVTEGEVARAVTTWLGPARRVVIAVHADRRFPARGVVTRRRVVSP